MCCSRSCRSCISCIFRQVTGLHGSSRHRTDQTQQWVGYQRVSRRWKELCQQLPVRASFREPLSHAQMHALCATGQRLETLSLACEEQRFVQLLQTPSFQRTSGAMLRHLSPSLPLQKQRSFPQHALSQQLAKVGVVWDRSLGHWAAVCGQEHSTLGIAH